VTTPHNSMMTPKQTLCLLGVSQARAVIGDPHGWKWREDVWHAELLTGLRKGTEEQLRPTKTSVPCCGHRRVEDMSELRERGNHA